MTVNISSLQSELLKLLNNGKDDEMEINEVDEMTPEEKNSVDIADVLPNADLKGGNDIADMVDNILTGGNVNEDKPEEKGTSEKEILSNILLDDKKEEGVDENDTSEKEILANILLDDKEGMSGGAGGKKRKGNKKVKKEKDEQNNETAENEQNGQKEPLTNDELDEAINQMIDNDEKQDNPPDDTNGNSTLSVLDVEISSEDESDKEVSNSENENSDEKDESDLSNDETPENNQKDELNEDFNDEYTSDDEYESDSDIAGGDLSDKYISIINEFTSTPKLSGGLVGGGSSSSSSSRIKLIPMFPYIVKAYD